MGEKHRHLFVPFKIARSLDALMDAAKEILNKYGGVFVRIPFGASGWGTLLAFSLYEVGQFHENIASRLKATFTGGRDGLEILVEAPAGIKYDNCAAYLIDGGESQYLGYGKMIIEETAHAGNDYIFGEKSPELQADEDEMHRMCEPIIAASIEQGFQGVLGVDGMILDSTRGSSCFHERRAVITEINARSIASAPLLYTAAKLIVQGCTNLAGSLRMFKVSNSPIRTFSHFVEALGSLAFDGESGVIPIVPTLLPSKVGVVVFSPLLSDNYEMISQVKSILEK